MPKSVRVDLALRVLAATVFVAVVYGHFFWPPSGYGIVDSDRFLAWQLVVNDALRRGALLHWNPYLCGGIPGLAEPESGVLSPFNVLGLIAYPALQMKLELLVHLAACFVGYELIARRLAVSPWFGLIGFYVAAGNGFVVARVLHGQTTFFPVLFVPLLLWCALSLETTTKDADPKNEPWRVALPYALVSLSILEDGFQPLIYGGVLLLGVAVAVALSAQSARPIVRVVSWLLVPVFLCAARTFPMAVLLGTHPRVVPADDFMTLGMAAKALFSGTQVALYEHFVAKPPHFPWAAYCAFVGVSPVILAAVGVVGRRSPSIRGVLWASAGGLALFFGHFAAWSPWALLHAIPPMTMVRFPNRFVIVPILAVSVLAMRGAARLVENIRFHSSPRITRLVFVGIVVGIAIEYAGATGPLLLAYVGQRAKPASVIDPYAAFRQFPGRPGALLYAVEHNVGVIGCSEALRLPNAARVGLPPAFLTGAGTTHVEVTPNVFTADFDAATPTTLVLNQNFDANFRVHGNARSEVVSVGGLLGVDVPKGRGKVWFEYDPWVFHIGCMMSAVTLLGALGLGLRLVARARS